MGGLWPKVSFSSRHLNKRMTTQETDHSLSLQLSEHLLMLRQMCKTKYCVHDFQCRFKHASISYVWSHFWLFFFLNSQLVYKHGVLIFYLGVTPRYTHFMEVILAVFDGFIITSYILQFTNWLGRWSHEARKQWCVCKLVVSQQTSNQVLFCFCFCFLTSCNWWRCIRSQRGTNKQKTEAVTTCIPLQMSAVTWKKLVTDLSQLRDWLCCVEACHGVVWSQTSSQSTGRFPDQ